MTMIPSGGYGASQVSANPLMVGGDLGGAAACLTPDALIAFVEYNLSQTDGKIQTLMAQTTSTKNTAAMLSDMASKLRNMQNHTRADQRAVYNDLGAEAEKLGCDVQRNANGDVTSITPPDGASDAVVSGITALNESLGALDAGTGARSTVNLESEAGQLESAANTMSSNSEVVMMQLQSLIEDRTRLVQFASNTIASLGESAKTAVNNIGRG